MTPTTPAPSDLRPAWLPGSEYPFQLRSVHVDGADVTYIDEGTGPLLLFVHTGLWSFVFRDVIIRLRDRFRCVALDFPGFGLSPEPPAEDLGLGAQADLLGRFAARLDLRDITLVVHDLGGPVGVGFAAAHPDRVSRLVMANTFAWKPTARPLRAMLRIMSSRPVTALDQATRLIPRLTTTKAGAGRPLSRAGRRAVFGPFRSRRRIRRFHQLMGDALRADDLYARIEAATADVLADRPVLTIFGERNDPFGFQKRHHALFADHEGIVIPKGFHFPMADDPERFAETVADWCRRKGAAT